MKISHKIGFAFLALIMLALILGVVGIYNMGSINVRTLDISTGWLPSVKAVTSMRNATNLMRDSEADHVLSSTEDEMLEAEKGITDAKVSLQKQVAEFSSRISSPEEKQLFEESKKKLNAYFAVQDQLLKLSRERESQAIATKEVFRNESSAAFTAYLGALGALFDFENKGAEDSAASAQNTYSSARLLMISLVLAGALIALALAVLILRDLVGVLGGEPADARRFAKEVANGNLKNQINIKPGDTTSMMAAIKEMQESLIKLVLSVRQGSEGVATASAQIAQGNQNLSGRTESQASALEETAASMEELSSTVKQNADNAKQANQLAQSASTVAVKGGEVVAQVVDTMKGINDSSKKISDIISVIDGIAFQTNILALNAAVEAARAGEQGRGFAVVASEVRSLAGRSADAAKEIKRLINASVERVEQGSILVDQAGVTMTEVVSSIRRVTDIMGEISEASTEQSQGVMQIGEAIQQMDHVTQQNATLVEEMAAAASNLKGQAQDLVQSVSVFHLEAQGNISSPPVQQRANVRGVERAPTAHFELRTLSATNRAPLIAGQVKKKVVATTSANDEWSSF